MTYQLLAHEVYRALSATLVLIGPFLGVAIILGLVLGLLQAVTQIQDQTVPQLVKIIALSLMVMAFTSTLAVPLYEHTLHLFTAFPYITR